MSFVPILTRDGMQDGAVLAVICAVAGSSAPLVTWRCHIEQAREVTLYEVVTCLALLLIFVPSSISELACIELQQLAGPSSSWKVLDKLADMDFTDDEVDTSLFWTRQQFKESIHCVNSVMTKFQFRDACQQVAFANSKNSAINESTIWLNLGGPWFNLWAFWSAFPGKGVLTKPLEVWCQVSLECDARFVWETVGFRNRVHAWLQTADSETSDTSGTSGTGLAEDRVLGLAPPVLTLLLAVVLASMAWTSSEGLSFVSTFSSAPVHMHGCKVMPAWKWYILPVVVAHKDAAGCKLASIHDMYTGCTV